MTREQILCLPIPENCCCEEHEACDAPDITPTGHGEIFVNDETCRVGGNARPTACPGCPAHKDVTQAAIAKPRWAMLEVESVAGTDDGTGEVKRALHSLRYDRRDWIRTPLEVEGKLTGDKYACEVFDLPKVADSDATPVSNTPVSLPKLHDAALLKVSELLDCYDGEDKPRKTLDVATELTEILWWVRRLHGWPSSSIRPDWLYTQISETCRLRGLAMEIDPDHLIVTNIRRLDREAATGNKQ